MSWKVGQLGRFKTESSRFPRFELIGVDKARRLVRVWYNLEKKPTMIPVDTFKKDCVHWWEMAKINYTVPDWVKKGALFQIESFEHEACLQWLKPDRKMVIITPENVLLNEQIKRLLGSPFDDFSPNTVTPAKQTFQIRSVCFDHTSCAIQGSGELLMIPLRVVSEAGVRRRTVWSRLADDFLGA
jgi:hypothetical protein